MTDLLTYLNVDLLGLKPFHLNVFKTGIIALCLALGVWVLASEGGLRHMSGLLARLDRLSLPRHRLLAWSLGALFASFLIQLGVRQYFELQTVWDMAAHANVAWHMVHGPWFFLSLDNRSLLGEHFSPVMLLVGLPYRVVEHPLTLLVIQSLSLGLGAVAVYYLTLLKCERKGIALLMIVLYMVNPYLHHCNAHDFHRVPLAIPTLLWLLVSIESNRLIPAIALSLLALSIEESIPPPLAGLGLFLAVFRPHWRAFGISLAALSTGYFFLVTKVLLPMFSPEQGLVFWEKYANLGANFNEALLSILLNPAWAFWEALGRHNQFLYLLYFLIPVAFLPLLAWREACLLAVPLLIMFLSQYDGQYKLGFHYSAPALPFLFYSTVYGMARASNYVDAWETDSVARRKAVCVAALFLVALDVYRCPGYDIGKTDPQFAAAAFEIAQLVPADAGVATDLRFAPLLANRHRICVVGINPGTLCEFFPWKSHGGFKRTDPGWVPEYVLIGKELAATTEQKLEHVRVYAEWLMAALGYQEIRSKNGIRLFQAPSVVQDQRKGD